MNNNLGTSKRLMKRFYLLAAFLFLFALVLVGKLIYIQFYENDKDLGIEPETLVKNVVLEPSRGDIYAADGNILATSISRYELHWDAITPRHIYLKHTKKTFADSLAQIYSRPSSQILQELEKERKQKNRYWLVAKDLSFSEYMRFKNFPIFNQNVYRGG